MLRRITLATTFAAALAIVGLAMSSTAEAGSGCGYPGSYYGGYRGFGPSYSVGYSPRYSAYYGSRAYPRYRSFYGAPHHHHHHRGVSFSIGF